MFGWLRRFWGGDPPDVYRVRERQIYRYFDGQKEVAADPLVLYKRVMDVRPALAVDIKVARAGMMGSKEAHEAVLGYVRQVFNLKPLADGGLTEAEALGLLDHFLAYVDGVKKNTRPSATSAAETSEASPSSSGEGPPTPSTSDSGATASGPSTGTPGPPPSGPAPPSGWLPPDSTTTGP